MEDFKELKSKTLHGGTTPGLRLRRSLFCKSVIIYHRFLHEKGHLFCQKWYVKRGKDLVLWEVPSRKKVYKTSLSSSFALSRQDGLLIRLRFADSSQFQTDDRKNHPSQMCYVNYRNFDMVTSVKVS